MEVHMVREAIMESAIEKKFEELKIVDKLREEEKSDGVKETNVESSKYHSTLATRLI